MTHLPGREALPGDIGSRLHPAATAGRVLVVWQSTAALTRAELAAALALLSDEEHARHAAIRVPEAARDYAAAHALLRRVLSHDRATSPHAWRFDRTPSGKPFLIEPGAPSFSLSHTQGLVACALAADAVGVDVEATDRDLDIPPIAARFFSTDERDDLDRLDATARRSRFFDLWTLKEAMVKACGRELSSSVRELSFQIDGADDHRRIRIAATGDIDPARWQFALFTPAAGFRLAVAAAHAAASQPFTISCAADKVLFANPAD